MSTSIIPVPIHKHQCYNTSNVTAHQFICPTSSKQSFRKPFYPKRLSVHLLQGQSSWSNLGLSALLMATAVIAHGSSFTDFTNCLRKERDHSDTISTNCCPIAKVSNRFINLVYYWLIHSFLLFSILIDWLTVWFINWFSNWSIQDLVA